MILIFTLFYIILNAILSVIAAGDQPQLLKLFLTGLFLTPLAAIAVVLIKKRKAKRVHFYYCEECDYIFPVKMHYCPICEEQGKKVKLIPYRSPYQLTKLVSTFSA